MAYDWLTKLTERSAWVAGLDFHSHDYSDRNYFQQRGGNITRSQIVKFYEELYDELSSRSANRWNEQQRRLIEVRDEADKERNRLRRLELENRMLRQDLNREVIRARGLTSILDYVANGLGEGVTAGTLAREIMASAERDDSYAVDDGYTP